MAVTLSLFAGAGAQFFDNNGNVLSGGKIYTYAAGTTTPLASYTSNSESAFHTNPIILDSAGRVPSGGEIWLQLGVGYKFVLQTAANVLIATYDNIPSSAQPPAANDANSIMYEQGYTVTAGSFVAGKIYRIATVGTTDFTLIGAVNNTVGTHFIATGAGTGTGTAELSQTVETRLQNTIYVTDFGAFKDGTNAAVTTAAIQAAIDYAKASSNVHCVEFPTGNYAINAPILIHGNFGFGLVIEGNKSTITSSHNGVAFSGNSAIPSPAPTFNIHLAINNLTFVGPGIANTSAVGVKLYGASYSLNNVYITAYFLGLQGAGCLISEFNSCTLTGNNIGSNFTAFDDFAPNDNHFYKCSWTYNNRAIAFGDFPYGSVTFIGCQIEGNNVSGNATDGVSVCNFSNAGEVTIINCHFESNPGEYNLIYDSVQGRHLTLIGCKVIPGDDCGTALYMGYGQLCVDNSDIIQAVGQNLYLGINNGGAVIIGDTAGSINGTLSKLVTIKQGRVATGNVNIGASLAGVGAKGASGIGAVVEGNINFNNSSGTRIGALTSNGASLDASASYTISTGFGAAIVTRNASVGFGPGADNTLTLGEAALRWSQVYAGNGTINTSDERAKQRIEAIPQEWLDAWGDVDYMRFKFNDAVEQKGSSARWHVGLIAQRVKEAFESRGIDPFSIGLLCFDQWDDIEIEKPVEDENGNPVIDEKTGEVVMQKRVIKVAGDQYGIRYEQALALECAYLRNKLKG